MPTDLHSFNSPQALWLLLGLPLIAFWAWVERRRRGFGPIGHEIDAGDACAAARVAVRQGEAEPAAGSGDQYASSIRVHGSGRCAVLVSPA